MKQATQKTYWNRVSSAFKEAGDAVMDFVYPPVCRACSSPIPFDRDIFCFDCHRDLAPAIPDACQRCQAPVGPYLDTSLGCFHCRTTPFHFDRLYRLGVYADQLKQACRAIKSPGSETLTNALGQLLWQREESRLVSEKIECVASVPKHWTQRLLPYHNPSATLARQFAKRLKIPYRSGLVVKTRRTPRQSHLPPSDRRTNLRDAFRLRFSRRILGRHVLLVDDVLTTGTTANRISRLLKKAGAKRVTVLVLARGLGDAR